MCVEGEDRRIHGGATHQGNTLGCELPSLGWGSQPCNWDPLCPTGASWLLDFHSSPHPLATRR